MTRRYRIATIPGNGIGPEVMRAAISVLDALAEARGDLSFKFIEFQAGDQTKVETGTALPAETLKGVKDSDATLFAAVGDTAKEVVLPLRQNLDLYVNLRPAKTYPSIPNARSGVNIVIVRENTEGLYKRIGYRGQDWSVSLRVITRRSSERIARFAFELAQRENRRRVTCVHKANVLDSTCGLFVEACRDVANNHLGVEYEEMIVDACAMKLVLTPEHFDVIVTTNMFGDILSDETAGLVGGLGMAPSGNIGGNHAIFEPVHGTAPDIAGKGVANPIAMILSARMMLEWLGEGEAAAAVEEAVVDVLREGKTLTPDLGGSANTDEVTTAIRKKLFEKEF